MANNRYKVNRYSHDNPLGWTDEDFNEVVFALKQCQFLSCMGENVILNKMYLDCADDVIRKGNDIMTLEKLLKELEGRKNKVGEFCLDISDLGETIEKHLKDYLELKNKIKDLQK